MKTKLSIQQDRFFINGSPVYSELKQVNPAYHGLLMNARMIQGVFDDKQDVKRFDRFGKLFSPEQNTDELIAALPQWYEKGLRAITVGFQGGGPCYTIGNYTIDNNPYSENGTQIDPAYLSRMDRIIRAADDLGMIVIVSLLYSSQTRFLKDDRAVIQAVKAACNWLRDEQFTNVIIEVANEQDIPDFKMHPIVFDEREVVELMDVAKRESGGLPVGCSRTGGAFDAGIAAASDVILIHGNGLSSQQFYDLIQKAKAVRPERPILCNEDSQALSRMSVAFREGVSWGYFNDTTKQEPPAYWEITKGEDEFFAKRLAISLGIEPEPSTLEEQFYLQGLEPHMTYEGKRWIRLASLYPERIDYVEFYRDGALLCRAYDESYMVNSVGNTWLQEPYTEPVEKGQVWKAKVFLYSGDVVEKTVVI